jgi:hypothetical protein
MSLGILVKGGGSWKNWDGGAENAYEDFIDVEVVPKQARMA